MGTKRLQPDFILLHPSRGLFVLEVKDWKLSTLQGEADRESVTILTEAGCKTVRHPLEQARDYLMVIAQQLGQDKR